MNVFRRAWNSARAGVKALFEAARINWQEASYLFGKTHQDAWRDISAADRIEMVSQHRYWVANSELVQRIRSLFIQFAVGPTGLNCTPNSKDEKWNEVRRDSFNNWGRAPEICSRRSLQELAIQWAGSLFDDGEFFILKLQHNGRPAIQTIESHRCCTPPSLRDREGKSIIDGVEIDGHMRPVAYWFVDDIDPSSDGRERKYKRVPAELVVHGFKSRRPGMYRGIPEGTSAYGTLHHYEDLHLLELKAAKKIANTAIIVSNETGEADADATRRARFNITSTNAAGTNVTKERALYYEQKLGGETVYVRRGDKVQNFECDRPSIVTQQYWDLLMSQICCGYNVPKLLVVPYSLQGTVTRADLDVCTSAFRFNFEIVAAALRDIYEWHCQWAVKYDRAFYEAMRAESVSNPTPPDYLCAVIRPPRPPNVDIGYSADALIKELEAGTVTYQDIFAERQQDWRQQFRQAAEAEKYKDDLSKEFGISPERIAKKLKESIAAPAQPGQPQPNAGAQTADPALTA